MPSSWSRQYTPRWPSSTCPRTRQRPRSLGRDQRGNHRHHPHDDCGLRAGGLHDRAGGHLLPPVRRYHGDLDRHLGHRRADVDAGAVRDDSEEPSRPAQAAHAELESFIDLVQSGFREESPGNMRVGAAADRDAASGHVRDAADLCAGHLRDQRSPPFGVRSQRGSGNDLCDHSDPSGLDARTDQRRRPPRPGDRQGRRGRAERLFAGGLRSADRRPRLQRRDLSHQLEELVRAQACRFTS